MVRAAGPIGAAVLLVLAGCSGIAGEPTPTLTPAPVPADRPTPGEAIDRDLAPGDRVDPLAVSTAHAARLRTTAHELVRRRTVRTTDGSLRLDRRVRRRVGPNGTRTFERVTVRGPGAPRDAPTRIERWRNGSRVLVAITREGRTRYESRTVADYGARLRGVYTTDQPGQELFALLAAIEPRMTARTEMPPGLRLVANRAARPREFASLVRGTEPRNVSFRAFLDPSGLVRERRLQYDVSRGWRRVRVSSRVRYTPIDGGIDRPPWYEAAVAATGGD